MSRWLALVICGCGVTATPPRPQPVSATPVVPADTQPPQTWRPVTTAPFSAAGLPILLTDGTVMVQELETENWWQLTPDVMGNYATGTWSKLASMPTGYSPLYTATAVLPDGRVIVEGGEYLAGDFAFTTKGAIYDPVAGSWSSVTPPAGWMTIGDASGMVLADGRFMLSSCCDGPPGPTAIFDPTSLTWSDTGGGKLDIHDEESWVMLWDSTILTIDCNNLTDLTAAESYDPATGMWSSAGHTPVQISDTDPDNSGSHEIGANVLLNDGTVLGIGGNGHNVTYDPKTQTWSAAPDFPVVAEGQLDAADGPAATLPNGHVLVATSPGVFNTPTHMFEWDGTAFTEVAAPPNSPMNTTYQQTMLVLPTGEILMTDFSTDVELYTPTPGYPDTAVPVITDLFAPTAARMTGASDPQPLASAAADPLTPVANLFLGQTYKLAALRMNGITQGAYYGDDQQTYTNYPIVRLTYPDTGHVIYARTHDHSNRAIGPDKHGTTLFDVPLTADRGVAQMQVIANGIPSPAILVNVK
jgi:hypothetical protein